MAPSVRRVPPSAVVAVVAGVLHAALVVDTALQYGYDVGPSAYPPHMLGWRYGGLVVLGALPVWLALRYRLVVPLALVVLLGGTAFYAEVTPPHATFSQVGDFTVVEDGLHLVKYAAAWYVWTVGALLVACWEVVVRDTLSVLPTSRSVPMLAVPLEHRRALRVAAGLGCLHALATLGFAWNLGLGDDPLAAVWVLVGGVLLVGTPVYLLVRERLLAPTAFVTLLFVQAVRAQQAPTPADPHALYAMGWFVYLGVVLVVAGAEYGLGQLWRRHRPALG
jgi:uncharacterized membrane protein